MKQKQGLAEKYGLRQNEVIERVGSVQLYRQMRAAHWLKPVINQHKLVLFDAGDVAKAWSRIVAGEKPEPKQQLAAI